MNLKKISLFLAFIITNVAFFISCNDDEPYDFTNASGMRSGYSNLMDTNTACFLNISYYEADLKPKGDGTYYSVIANTVDAYCSDGDAQNPKFINKKYIRCNGEDMKIWYNDPQNIGRYGWSTETIEEPLNHLKIEMDYFDEDCIFEFDMSPKITIVESSMAPKGIHLIEIDPEKGFEIHYTGGGSGTAAWMNVGYGAGNGFGKPFIDDGGGVIKFSPEEVKMLTMLFMEGEELEKFDDACEERYGYRTNGKHGIPITIFRDITTKTNFKNGKNIVANISQTDDDGLYLTIKK